MPIVPLLKSRQVVKALEKLGWEVARQRGSHIILTKEGHIVTLSVLNHPEVARGTLRSLIARAGITLEEFLEAVGR
jgi:predicted RNA binding protein YcfA (HicA-like mRNA interferase family)